MQPDSEKWSPRTFITHKQVMHILRLDSFLKQILFQQPQNMSFVISPHQNARCSYPTTRISILQKHVHGPKALLWVFWNPRLDITAH